LLQSGEFPDSQHLFQHSNMQKGSISNLFLTGAIIILVVVGVLYAIMKPGKPVYQGQTDTSTYNAGTNELDTIQSELDFETEANLDTEINQLDTDVASLN
jgi:hypothetical protein